MPGVSPTTVAVVHASLLFDASYRRRLNILGFLVSKRETEAEFMRGFKIPVRWAATGGCADFDASYKRLTRARDYQIALASQLIN